MPPRTKRAMRLDKAQAIEKIGLLFNELCTEVMSFKGTGHAEWFKHWQPDLPSWLNTSHGEVRLNRRALAIIHEISDIVGASDAEARALVEPDARFAAVSEALGETLLWASDQLANKTPVELDAAAENFVGRLSESLKSDRVDVTWFVPCHIFDEDQSAPRFSVGPVTFHPRAEWLAETYLDLHKTSVADHWSGAVSQEELLKRTHGDDPKEAARAWATYDTAIRLAGAPWVAEVHVPGHTASRSRRKADALVDLALNFVCLACGPENASAIVADGRHRRATRERSLGFDPKGHCLAGSSIHKLGVGGEKGFAAAFVTKAEPVFADGGALLYQYLADSATETVSPLVERWVGALYWFGLAAHEPLDFMALVQYSCAIDIVSDAGGNLPKLTQFVEAAFARQPGAGLLNDGTPSKDVLNRIYNDGRSGLVHGSRHGLLEDLSEDRRLAFELVRKVLLAVVTRLSNVVREKNPMLGLERKRATSAFLARLQRMTPAPAAAKASGAANDPAPRVPVRFNEVVGEPTASPVSELPSDASTTYVNATPGEHDLRDPGNAPRDDKDVARVQSEVPVQQ